MAQQLQTQVGNEADLMARLATGGCKVVEVYSEWSGPCKSILPTFKKLRLEGKEEEVLAFLVVAAESCQHIEPIKEHRGKSEPLFLVYRNGTLKSKIDGVNVPSLLEGISEWLTPLPGQDDLEENPIYMALKGDKDGAASKDSKHVLKQLGAIKK